MTIALSFSPACLAHCLVASMMAGSVGGGKTNYDRIRCLAVSPNTLVTCQAGPDEVGLRIGLEHEGRYRTKV